MQHISASSQACLILVVLVLVMTVNIAECKRGCAYYGHACFGGHGKRSMPESLGVTGQPRPFNFIQQQQQPQQSTHLEIPLNYDNSIDDSYPDESPEQDFKYAVYGLFRQWMNDIRKVRSTEKRNSAAYELLKATAAADPSAQNVLPNGHD